MFSLHTRAASIVLLGFLVGFHGACSRRSSDESIAKDIQAKLAADSETKDSDVSVVAKDGKVTLTGTVQSPAAREKVEQIAHEGHGTAAVDDETTLPPPPQPVVVPTGTVLVVTVDQALGSKTSQSGQTFLAALAQPVSVEGRIALPAGATVSGTVVTAKAKGKVKGEGELTLALKSISVNGQTYAVQTSVLGNTVKGKGKRTAATTGGGAAGGALIGGIAGGGKGAGIGALVGAGAGFVGGALTGNKQIEIPAESALSFTLVSPLTLPPPNQ